MSSRDGERDCRCGRPLHDQATFCETCGDRLARALGEVPWVVEELETTLTGRKGVDYRRSGGAAPSEVPLPVNLAASDLRGELKAILTSWVRFCHDEHIRHQSPSSDLPADNPQAMSRWLLWRVDGLALHDIGPDAVDEITKIVERSHRLVFWKKKNRIYLGTCGHTETADDGTELAPCPGEVYADDGAEVGACDDCNQPVTVAIRKSDIDKRLEDHLCTPAEIATYAVHLGLRASRESVRTQVNYWNRNKRIEKRGEAANGDPLFRYGEVRTLLYTRFADKVKD